MFQKCIKYIIKSKQLDQIGIKNTPNTKEMNTRCSEVLFFKILVL
jgi:hypothetical protein